MQQLISKEILENCRLNDRKAQRTVYETLFTTSMRVCKRYCNNQEEAMEVLNTGFLKVFTQLEKYSGKGSFEGWVHRIMVNTALDHLRNERKYHDHLMFSEKLEEFPEDDNDEEPENIEITLDALYGMIAELPPATRMVFNLYVFEDFSHEEISQELGISTGTSKWHLHSARNLLQQSVKKIFQKVQ